MLLFMAVFVLQCCQVSEIISPNQLWPTSLLVECDEPTNCKFITCLIWLEYWVWGKMFTLKLKPETLRMSHCELLKQHNISLLPVALNYSIGKLTWNWIAANIWWKYFSLAAVQGSVQTRVDIEFMVNFWRIKHWLPVTWFDVVWSSQSITSRYFLTSCSQTHLNPVMEAENVSRCKQHQ